MLLGPFGGCFPSSFMFCSCLDSCSLFLCVLVKRFLTWAASIVDIGVVFCSTPSKSLQIVKKEVALEADRNKGVIKCKKIGLSRSISPRDPSLVTVVSGQQMAKCEQQGKSSGIPGKCISGSCVASEGTLLTAQSARQSSV